jgi:hypothetical protein
MRVPQVIGSPVTMISVATLRGMTLASLLIPPAPASSPRFGSGRPNFASSPATIMSQASDKLHAARQSLTADRSDPRLPALRLDKAAEAEAIDIKLLPAIFGHRLQISARRRTPRRQTSTAPPPAPCHPLRYAVTAAAMPCATSTLTALRFSGRSIVTSGDPVLDDLVTNDFRHPASLLRVSIS